MKKKLLLVICLALVMVLALSAVALADTAIASLTSVSGLTMPQAGQTLDFTVQSNHSWCYVDSVEWDDYTGKDYDLTTSHKAIAGHKYRYTVRLKPYSGYYFPYIENSNSSDPRWQFYKYTAKLDGVTCTTNKDPGPYAVVYAETSKILDITGYYTVPEAAGDTEIKSVSVNIDKPVAGQPLDFTASGSGNYSFYKVDWDDYTAKEYSLSQGTIAIAGHKYRCDIWLKPNSGYIFPYTSGSNPGSDWQFYNGTAKLNGEYCSTNKDPGPYATVYVPTGNTATGQLGITVYYTAGSAAGISNVALTVDAPVIGAKPATSFKAVNKSNSIAVSPEYISWEEKTDSGYWRAISTEIFVQGVQYRVQMVVKPASGCFAGAEGSTTRVNTYTGSLTVNGSKPASGTYDVYATGEDGTSFARCLVVTYDFPALGSAPVITKQPAAQSAIPGGSAVFTVEASGESLKYQWYGGTDASPTPVGGNDKTLTLTNLTLNNDGTDFWCVVSNEAGSVISCQQSWYSFR